MDSPGAPMPLAAGLLSHPDIVSVSCAVQMAKGFRFHLIVTSSTALAEAAVDAIVLCVRNEQGSSPALRWLVRGIETRAGSSPVTFPDLVRLVLEPVLGQYPDSTLQGALVVVDATGARTEERAAWSDLFRRMNELRNEFVRALRSSFIMILPEPLEVEFAHVASDFWSIRSSAIHLSTELRPLAPSREREQERERSIAGFAPPTQELETRVRELREQVKKPPTEIAQAALAVALGQLADNLAERGSAGRALELTLDARELLEQLVISAPHRVDFQRDLSVSYERMGDLMRALGQGDQAKAFFEKSLLIRERLARSEPDRADFQQDLAISHERMGDLAVGGGDGKSAFIHFDTSRQIWEKLIAAEPGRADLQKGVCVPYDRLGNLMLALGQGDQAKAFFEKALQIAERLARSEPDRADFQRNLSVSYERMGDLMRALGQGDQAKAFFEKDLQIAERLARSEPDRADFQHDLSVSYNKLGDLMLALGRSDQARSFFEKDLQIAERLARSEPDRADYQYDLAWSLLDVATVQPETAPSLRNRALQILWSLKASGRVVKGLDALISRAQASLTPDNGGPMA